MLGQFLAYSFNILVPVLVVRYLEVEEYGVYKQLFLIIMTVSFLLPLGIIESLYYFIPRDREAKRHYISQALWFMSLMSAGFLLLMFFAGRWFFAALNMDHLYVFILPMSVYTVAMTLSLPLEKLLLIDERVVISSVLTFLSELIKGGTIIASVVLTGDIMVLMYSLVCFALLRLGVFFFYLSGKRLISPPWRVDLEKTREHMGYSLPFGFAVAVATIRRLLHNYFVTFLFTARDFAIYSMGSFLLPMMNLIYVSVSNVVLIRVSEYHRKNDHQKIIEVWNNSARKLGLIYLPVTIFFLIAAREFISGIFTERYLESVPIFSIAILQIPIDIFITHSILKAFAETRFILKVNVVLLALTAVFIYLGITMLGMQGAIMATVFSFGLIKAVELIKVKGLLGVGFAGLIPLRELSRILYICLLSGVCAFLVKLVLAGQSPFLVFLLEGGTFFSVYSVFVLRSRLLHEAEKAEFKRVISRVLFWQTTA